VVLLFGSPSFGSMLFRDARTRGSARIPVAQASRPRIVRAAAWSRWERKPSPRGKGEPQNPSAHLARKPPTRRRVLPAPDISLLMGRESFAKNFSTPDTASGWRGIACWLAFPGIGARSHRDGASASSATCTGAIRCHWHSRHANHAGCRSAFTAGCARLSARHERI
jgi:hypothetical protein